MPAFVRLPMRRGSRRLVSVAMAALLLAASIPAVALAAAPTPAPGASSTATPPTVSPAPTPASTPASRPTVPPAAGRPHLVTPSDATPTDPLKAKIAALLEAGRKPGPDRAAVSQSTVKQNATRAPTPRKVVPATLAIGPSSASIQLGKSQTFAAFGYDAAGKFLGDVTDETKFTIDGAPCAGPVCTPKRAGMLVVEAVDGSARGSAALTVTKAGGAATSSATTPRPTPSPASTPPAQPSAADQVEPAATSASVSGRVTDENGVGLSGIGVAFVRQDVPVTVWAFTNATGNFSIPNVGGATYRIQATDSTGHHVMCYYATSATGHCGIHLWDSTWLTVGTASVSGITIAMPTGVRFSGRLTNPAGIPWFQARVDLWNSDLSAETWTDSSGNYAVSLLPDETYTMEIWGDLESGYYTSDGLTQDDTAMEGIDVGSDDIVLPTMTLRARVAISGRVTGPGGVPVSGISVQANAATPNGHGGPGSGSANTASDGTYAVRVNPDLDAVDLAFVDYSNRYPSGWYMSGGYSPSVPWGSGEHSLATGTSDMSGINVQLPLGAHITGKVTDQDGKAIGSASIWPWVDLQPNGQGTAYPAGWSATDGTFSLTLPANDDYFLYTGANGYATGFYGPGGFARRPGDATAIHLATATVSGINIVLPATARVTGHLDDGLGQGRASAQIWFCPSGTTDSNDCDMTISDANGDFSMSLIVGWDYYIDFQYHDGSTNYDLYYDAGAAGGVSPFPEDATLVSVPVGGLTGLDVVLPAPHSIGGIVYDAASHPAAGIEVLVFDPADLTVYGDEITDAQGQWSVPVLAGTYSIYFYDATGTCASGYMGPSGFTYDITSALAVTITTWDWSNNIRLPLPLHVKGTVKTSAGGLAAGVEVDVYDVASGALWNYATTDSNGVYSVVVVPGTYVVGTWDESLTYPNGYWTSGGFTQDPALAGELAVAAADVTANIQFPTAHLLSGTITDAYGSPVQDMQVWTFSSTGNALATIALSDQDGYYAVLLVNGSYFVGYRDPGRVFAAGWWAGSGFSLDADAAALVAVAADVSDLNVTIPSVPDAPTDAAATRGDGNVLVTWSAPERDGGLPITSYVAYNLVDDHYCEWTEGPMRCLVTGLENGTEYVFYVFAINDAGYGFDSDPTNAVTPAGLPGAPTNVTAAAGFRSVNVSWTAADANGAAITRYSVISRPDSAGCTTTGATSCSVTGLTPGVSYSFQVEATNDVGTGPRSDPSGLAAAVNGATYHKVAPSRVLDSRSGLGGRRFSSRVVQTVLVANGRSGVPADAVAVTGNVTITGPTHAGYVTVAPALASWSQPPTSTINFTAFDTRANAVTAPLAAGGRLDFMYWTNSASDVTQIIFDVTGYFANDTSGATYHTVTPSRALDSRSGLGGHRFSSRVVQTVAIANGASGVPSDAVAVTGNVTITGQTRAGYVTVAPSLTSWSAPATSTINFPAKDTRANAVTVPLASGGRLDFMYWTNSASDTIQVIFDVTGYFANDKTGSTYHTVTPSRALDSRSGLGAHRFQSRNAQTVRIANGSSGVPADAEAVTGNVTVTGQSHAGYVTVAPYLTSWVAPETSTINFPVGDTRANGVTVPLAWGGSLDFMYWSSSGSDMTQVIFDVTGFFAK